jgi:hypothetical protein
VEEGSKGPSMPSRLSRSITIISSPLTPLFPPLAEDAPSPASAVVVFPSGALSRVDAESDSQSPPVHIFVHSSDTEECPKGQSEYPHAIVPRHFLMNNLMNTYLHCLNNIDDIISDKLILA